MTTRCKWYQDDSVNQKHYDEEWGIPVHDDRKHFEFLMMEVIQCGLNWTMMLNKRKVFHQYFGNFGYEKTIHYDKKKVQEIMETPRMIYSPRKIWAIITNARAYLEIIREYDSFGRFLWSYTNGKILVHKSHQQYPITNNDMSDTVNEELKKKDFKCLDSIVMYSHPQACGVVNDREESHFLHRQLCDRNSMEYRD